MPGKIGLVIALSTGILGVAIGLATAQGLGGDPPKAGEGEGRIVGNESPTGQQQKYYAWTETQYKLTWGIVGFAAVLFVGQFAVMFVSKQFWTDRQFKAFTLTLLLTTGLVLIIAGFTDAQIAPMMGLIGTIAGYVLGSAETEKVSKSGEVSEAGNPT